MTKNGGTVHIVDIMLISKCSYLETTSHVGDVFGHRMSTCGRFWQPMTFRDYDELDDCVVLERFLLAFLCKEKTLLR